MIGILDDIPQKHGGRIDHVEHYVGVAVIEQIAKSRSACGDHDRQAATCRWSDLRELGAVQIAKQQRALGPGRAPILLVHARINVSIRNKKVEKSVVVIVQKTRSPAE